VALFEAPSDISEGHQVLRKSRELLNSVHMTLKGEEPPVDLALGHIAVLGIELRKQGNRLQYRPPNSLWDELDETLEEAYDTPDPHMTASTSLRGWVDTYGMVFETVEEMLEKILQHAATYGLRELDSDDLCNRWQRSRKRWHAYRKEAMLNYEIM